MDGKARSARKWIAVVGSIMSCTAFVAAGLLAGQKSIIVLEILMVLIGATMGMIFPGYDGLRAERF